MALATSGFHEALVNCDIEQLTKVPPYTETEWMALRGASANQVSFAASVRTKKMAEWKPDLPPLVFQALCGIADATWWLANQRNDSSSIGWPKSWTGSVNSADQSELPAVAPANQGRDKVLERVAAAVPATDFEQFEQFARRVCQMPDMAYLTMLTLLYRQTRDDRLLARIAESRRKIDGYLDAIDNILGSPGA